MTKSQLIEMIEMTKPKHIHLIGICGTAMASLAGMLQERGFQVTGSDAASYPPMSTFLESLGIPVSQPFAEANLRPRPDLVVIGNALSRGNVELERVLDDRIPFCSLPQILHDEFLLGKEVLIVAGTHGKTTTTSMLAWIFETAGLQPSFLIGGIAENFGRSFGLAEGKHFILEGDEYDTAFFDKGPKFLHYFPDSVILTSVEFDHADIYKDLDAVETAFKRLVNLVPRGRIIAFDPNGFSSERKASSIDRCLPESVLPGRALRHVGQRSLENRRSKVERGTHLMVAIARWQGLGRFRVPSRRRIQRLERIRDRSPGGELQHSKRSNNRSAKNFSQRKAPTEVKAEINGITIIDDFAHHPTAIEQTIRALRARHPHSRLWVILEPRSNTMRRNVLQESLARSLAEADHVVIAAIFKSEAIPEAERLDLNHVVEEITRRGKQARILADADAIVAAIAPELRKPDVVAILSNGGFGNIYEKLPQRLRALGAKA